MVKTQENNTDENDWRLQSRNGKSPLFRKEVGLNPKRSPRGGDCHRSPRTQHDG